MRGQQRGAGFTLVELCVVLSIVFVLFSLSLVSFTSFVEFYQLNSYKRQIISDLRQAKQAAVAGGNYVAVIFYPKTDSNAYYVVYSLKPSAEQILLYQRTLPISLDFVDEKEIRFAASSFCVPGYLGSIYIKGKSGREVKIVVSSFGRVR